MKNSARGELSTSSGLKAQSREPALSEVEGSNHANLCLCGEYCVAVNTEELIF
jgi:hypothetical protein